MRDKKINLVLVINNTASKTYGNYDRYQERYYWTSDKPPSTTQPTTQPKPTGPK